MENLEQHTISVADLKQRLEARAAGTDDFVLVDCREPDEFAESRIDGSVLIPKGEFLTGEAFAKLPVGKQVVIHCRSGKRSADALEAAVAHGLTDAVHVGGGILAWQEAYGV